MYHSLEKEFSVLTIAHNSSLGHGSAPLARRPTNILPSIARVHRVYVERDVPEIIRGPNSGTGGEGLSVEEPVDANCGIGFGLESAVEMYLASFRNVEIILNEK